MEKVKESIVTIEDMFNEEFEKFEKMLADSLEEFRKNDCENEDIEAEILMATCEGKLQAYAQVAKELLGDESLEEKYLLAIDKYANEAMEMACIIDEMDDENGEEEIDEDYDEEFDKALKDYLSIR